jgi:uncharacterized protein YueI
MVGAHRLLPHHVFMYHIIQLARHYRSHQDGMYAKILLFENAVIYYFRTAYPYKILSTIVHHLHPRLQPNIILISKKTLQRKRMDVRDQR